MPSESTPLLQRVPVAEPHQRYPHQLLRRACTILLVSACIVVPFLFFLVPDTASESAINRRLESQLSVAKSWPESTGISYDELQDIILDTPSEEHIRQWSQYYTSGPHLAGKNASQAEWTQQKWRDFGILDVQLVSYEVYVNYPEGHRLALRQTDAKGEVTELEATLEEDVLPEDETTGLKNRVPTFHGYSASGNVTSQYVYCNYGTYEDYEAVMAAGIYLEGKIALVKYGGIFRGLKVKRAQELRMLGVVMYSDPGDDSVQTFNPEEQYPQGPGRNPSSVQRGSVQFLSFGPGDPTTIGYPSKPGVPRLSPLRYIPNIPSLPISYTDALPLLLALNNHGPNASSFPSRWRHGGLAHYGVQYNLGPSPWNTTLNLVNQQTYTTTPFHNVIGIINGTNPNDVLILGNHRDAWVAGGAADPNSGSAALLELARALGIALSRGWKPLRTIVLASWDGEEYGLVGSTEWVEEFLPWLSDAAIAYINVDVGTSGSAFGAAAAPLLNRALIAATKAVLSPNQTVPGQSIHDLWSRPIKTMGSGSDFTAFQDFAGIPCADFGFGANPSLESTPGTPVYHYHSNYDSFAWMERFGDPGWHYHAAVARVWGVLVTALVESPVIPFSAVDYADALVGYVEQTKAKMPDGKEWSLKKLDLALGTLRDAAVAVDEEAASISAQLSTLKTHSRWRQSRRCLKLYRATHHINDKYKYLERQFLYQKGLDGREWFKHTVFAPGLWTGYSGAVFPGLVESIERGDWEGFERWEGIVVGEVEDATNLLRV